MLGGNLTVDLHSIQGEVVMLLDTSCYGNYINIINIVSNINIVIIFVDLI